MAYEAKFFSTMGEDLDDFLAFLNKIGHESIVHLNTVENGFGARGAHVIYKTPDKVTNQSTVESRDVSADAAASEENNASD